MPTERAIDSPSSRFRIDQWDPAYGPSSEGFDEPADRTVRYDAEIDLDEWRPVRPPGRSFAGERLAMIDGVRRLDAGIWIDDDDGPVLGLCASVAAGRIRLDHEATVEEIRVDRVLAAAVAVEPIVTRVGTYRPVRAQAPTTDSLSLAVQDAMARLETGLAPGAGEATMLIVDGPLRDAHLGRIERRPELELVAAGSGCPILGYVKRHHTYYLPGPLMARAMAMPAGARTPILHLAGRMARWTWYLALPSGSGESVGLARIECDGRLDVEDAVVLADTSSRLIPRYASDPFRDARAPQNLYPIGAIEREARHRLGDPRLVRRALAGAARLPS